MYIYFALCCLLLFKVDCVLIEDSFHQQTGLEFKEETSKVLHLEHSFVWC
jgi:hypothetical protein